MDPFVTDFSSIIVYIRAPNRGDLSRYLLVSILHPPLHQQPTQGLDAGN